MVSKGKLRRRTKRTTTKDRVKAEKKVREHNRKIRKDKKKNPGKYAKSKKDPGVPNECPFKEKVLQECEVAREQKAAEKERRRELAKQKRAESRAQALEEKRTKGTCKKICQNKVVKLKLQCHCHLTRKVQFFSLNESLSKSHKQKRQFFS